MTKDELFNILKADKIRARDLVEVSLDLTQFVKKVRGTTFCFAHSDSNHPSAKMYDDGDRHRLFCFACRKQYTVWDYIRIKLNEDPLEFTFKNVDFKILENNYYVIKDVVYQTKSDVVIDGTIIAKFKAGMMPFNEFISSVWRENE